MQVQATSGVKAAACWPTCSEALRGGSSISSSFTGPGGAGANNSSSSHWVMKTSSLTTTQSPGKGRLLRWEPAAGWPATAQLLGSTNHPPVIFKLDHASWAQRAALSSCCIDQTADFCLTSQGIVTWLLYLPDPPAHPVTVEAIEFLPWQRLQKSLQLLDVWWNRWLDSRGAYCCLHQRDSYSMIPPQLLL